MVSKPAKLVGGDSEELSRSLLDAVEEETTAVRVGVSVNKEVDRWSVSIGICKVEQARCLNGCAYRNASVARCNYWRGASDNLKNFWLAESETIEHLDPNTIGGASRVCTHKEQRA